MRVITCGIILFHSPKIDNYVRWRFINFLDVAGYYITPFGAILISQSLHDCSYGMVSSIKDIIASDINSAVVAALKIDNRKRR
jgi:hypothetical protein